MTTSTRHVLAPVAAIPLGEGRAFAAGEQQVAVFRLRDGSLRALEAVCPHAGGPLADGLVDSAKVVCPLHNYTYALADGSCVNGEFAVRTFAVREEAGEIILDL
jgi:nitrite reductase [NAD(P)H] small subunit